MSNKISVAMCTYNGEKFLQKQLESIFSQTFTVNEIIICDDGSTDGTEDIVNIFSRKYIDIISFHKNEVNLKSVKNFEKAISLTTGDFIFLCDQDDLWHPQKVEKIINHFEKNPKAEAVFTDAVLIDDNENPIKDYTLWLTCIFRPEIITACGGFWKTYQSHDNMVTGATMCIKKIAKGFIFPFPESPEFHHDEWLALHFAQRETLFLLEDKLTFYRIHQNQQVGGGLIERYETEKEYIDMVLNFKKPKNFQMYFKVFNRIYVLYNKHYQLMQNKDSYGIDIEGLVNGDKNSLITIGKKIRKRYPILFTYKRFRDFKKNRRQIFK